MLLLAAARIAEREIVSSKPLACSLSGARLVAIYTPRGVTFCAEIPLRVMGKPRMTQRDKWMKRPSVMKARSQSDLIRAAFNTETKYYQATCVSWVAVFQTTKFSAGAVHRAKPDRDNIDKLILDALFSNDEGVGGLSGTQKMWADEDVLLIAIEGLTDAENS